MSELKSAKDFIALYKANVAPYLGTRVFSYARQRISDQGIFYAKYLALVSTTGSNNAAIAAMQTELSSVGFQGRSKKPNWAGYLHVLRSRKVKTNTSPTSPEKRARGESEPVFELERDNALTVLVDEGAFGGPLVRAP